MKITEKQQLMLDAISNGNYEVYMYINPKGMKSFMHKHVMKASVHLTITCRCLMDKGLLTINTNDHVSIKLSCDGIDRDAYRVVAKNENSIAVL